MLFMVNCCDNDWSEHIGEGQFINGSAICQKMPGRIDMSSGMQIEFDTGIIRISTISDSQIRAYQEWFGSKKGKQYAHRYFARVLATLAGHKIGEGKFSEAVRVIAEIFQYSEDVCYNSVQIFKQSGKICIKRIIPNRYLPGRHHKIENLSSSHIKPTK